MLQTKGIQCIVSNHDSEITRELYKKSNIFELKFKDLLQAKSLVEKSWRNNCSILKLFN